MTTGMNLSMVLMLQDWPLLLVALLGAGSPIHAAVSSVTGRDIN